jgi:hypothetical protein
MRKFARRLGIVVAAAAMGAATVGLSASAAQASPTALKIQNVNSGLRLAVDADSNGHVQPFSPVVQRPASTPFPSFKTWHEEVHGAAVTIVLNEKIQSNGTFVPGCLDLPTDVPRAAQPDKGGLVIRACDGTVSQLWKPFPVAGTTFTDFENELSLMLLDIRGSSHASGAQAIQNAEFATSADFLVQ